MSDMPVAVIADISKSSAENSRRILEAFGYRISDIVDDGMLAVAKCIKRRADILLIDAVLPSLDGVAAMRRLREMRLAKYPAIIIAAYAGLTLPIGSPVPGMCIIDKPITENKMHDAIEMTSFLRRRMPEVIHAKLNRIFGRLGLPEHLGSDYLMDAAFLAHEDRALTSALTSILYPMLAKRHSVTAAAVERAMRYAIEFAWANGNIDEQYSVFKGTIDASRGKPTCGGMIAQLAEMLRMEDDYNE